MESFRSRLNKLAHAVIHFRRVKETTGFAQAIISSILAVGENLAAILLVVLTYIPDFTGKTAVQIISILILILTVLVLSLFQLRERAFNNKISSITLRRLERKLDRLSDMSTDATAKLDLLEKLYDELCDEFDKVDLANSTNAQYYQPSNNPLQINPFASLNRQLIHPNAPILPPPPPPFWNSNGVPPPPPPAVVVDAQQSNTTQA